MYYKYREVLDNNEYQIRPVVICVGVRGVVSNWRGDTCGPHMGGPMWLVLITVLFLISEGELLAHRYFTFYKMVCLTYFYICNIPLFLIK